MINKYMDLARELKKKPKNMNVTVVQIMVGALGNVYKGLKRRLKEF